jgi:hypothetical protein
LIPATSIGAVVNGASYEQVSYAIPCLLGCLRILYTCTRAALLVSLSSTGTTNWRALGVSPDTGFFSDFGTYLYCLLS